MNKKQIIHFMDKLASGDSTSPQPDESTEFDSIRTSWMHFKNAEAACNPTNDSMIDENQCAEFDQVLRGFQQGLSENQRVKTPKTNPFFEQLFQTFFSKTALPVAIALMVGFLFINQQIRMEKYEKDIRDLKQWIAQTAPQTPESITKIEQLYAQTAFVKNQSSKFTSDPLIQALRMDPSVNVRLSALYSLEAHANDPQLRELLKDSIPFQNSQAVILEIAQIYLSNCSESEIPEFIETLQASPLENQWIRQLKTKPIAQI